MHFSAKRGIAIARRDCRLSVRLSVCDVGELCAVQSRFAETRFAETLTLTLTRNPNP